MGLSLSCPGDEYGVLDDNLEALLMRSISVKERSMSSNGQEADQPPLTRPFGPGKMNMEGPLSIKGREVDSFRSETRSSVKTPRLRELEVSSPCSRCPSSPLERVMVDAEVGRGSPKYKAALQVQKVYKSFRTRRKLADCAVIVEQSWWKLLEFAVLKQSSVSFFDISKQESAISRWSRARTRAAKVGKGLSKDDKARKLALQHWLEAIDPRHRYGHNLSFYYESWLNCDSRQPFFYWLDVGEGRDCDLEECSRSTLQKQCIRYLGPKEREAYEAIVQDGKFIYKQSQQLLNTYKTSKDIKWIFVLSTLKKLYVGQKKKGTFQHSSFLAGGATSAAGRLEVENGVLKAVWPHSGHYRPTEENFQELISFLKENNVDLTNVENTPVDDEEASTVRKWTGLKRDPSKLDLHREVITEFGSSECRAAEQEPTQKQPSIRRKNVTVSIPDNRLFIESLMSEAQVQDEPSPSRFSLTSPSEKFMSPKHGLFEEDPEEDQEPVSEECILRRLMSKKALTSYQLGKQLSCKWTTGAGPRIGCMRDYPTELQSHALEKMNLSPRTSSSPQNFIPGYSESYLSPRHVASGSSSSRAYSSPRCLSSPSPLSLSKERGNSFHNSTVFIVR